MRKAFIGICLLLLAACGAPKPRLDAGQSMVKPQPPAGAGVYRVDSARTELRLLVYRAGSMARLGHDHVITNRALTGWVRYSGDVAAADWSLMVPVGEFVVDDPAARSEEGAEFSEVISDDAKAGTRHNMLSAALLDGERYPSITLNRVRVTQTPTGATAVLSVSVAGHDSTLLVPLTFDAAAGLLTVSGSVTLQQTVLGLTPFSVMMGALQVRDALTVKFKLTALQT